MALCSNDNNMIDTAFRIVRDKISEVIILNVVVKQRPKVCVNLCTVIKIMSLPVWRFIIPLLLIN